ncbi:MAG TPA: carboxypeptidase-like regulatory domain-containing protein [Pseudomonadota bacterium]|nr:carboxypeptidase-like regulatory domain-containing protein [Pseudomonadota bacterium]
MLRFPRSAPPAAVLFLLVGTLGGALGGAFMGFRAGLRSQPVRPASSSPAVGDLRLDAGAGSRAILSPADQGVSVVLPAHDRVSDAGTDAGTASALTEVCIEVCDVGEHRVAGALITHRAAAPTPLRATSAVGELGVYAAPLPFPDDVIAGGAPKVPSTGLPAAGAAGGVLRTDSAGRACLRAAGRVLITAAQDERSASLELDLPATGGRVPGFVVLRLGIPPDALCRLAGPAEAAEPGSESVSSGPGGEVTGQVVDGRGYAVAGVRIDAQVGTSRAVALSDQRGTFRLSGLPRGPLGLSAQKRGFAPLSLSRRGDEPRTEVTLTLAPGGGIAGTVRDRARGGLPPGATLSLQTSTGTQPLPLSRDGGFSLTGLPVGNAVLRARAPGFAPLSLPIDIPAGQAPDELTLRDLRLELEPAATLRGQVRGELTSRGGVAVTATTADGTICGRALTDDRGEFRLSDLPAGPLQIRASAGPLSASSHVELRPGGQEQIELELR